MKKRLTNLWLAMIVIASIVISGCGNGQSVGIEKTKTTTKIKETYDFSLCVPVRHQVLIPMKIINGNQVEQFKEIYKILDCYEKQKDCKVRIAEILYESSVVYGVIIDTIPNAPKDSIAKK